MTDQECIEELVIVLNGLYLGHTVTLDETDRPMLSHALTVLKAVEERRLTVEEIWKIIVKGLESRNLVGGNKREEAATDIATALHQAAEKKARGE